MCVGLGQTLKLEKWGNIFLCPTTPVFRVVFLHTEASGKRLFRDSISIPYLLSPLKKPHKMSVKYTMKNNTEKTEKSVFIRDKIMMMPFVCGKEYYFGKKFENALLYFVTFLMVLFGTKTLCQLTFCLFGFLRKIHLQSILYH